MGKEKNIAEQMDLLKKSLKYTPFEKPEIDTSTHLDIIPGQTTSKNVKDIIPLGVGGGMFININPKTDVRALQGLSLSADVHSSLIRSQRSPNIEKTTTSDTGIKSLVEKDISFSAGFTKKFKDITLGLRYSKGGNVGFKLTKSF